MSRQYWTELLAWATADGTAVANTTTETIIFPNVTLPANYLSDGRVIELIARGRLSAVSAATMRFRLRWGGVAGTLVWDSGIITSNSPTAALWSIPSLHIQVRSNGSTGSVFVMGECYVGSAAAATVASATGAPAVVLGGSGGDDTPAGVTVDLTADTALSLTATWGAASASNTLTGHQYLLKSLN